MIKILLSAYSICGILLVSVYYSMGTDSTILLPKSPTANEWKVCNNKKPTFNSMLVVEENKIYWNMENEKRAVCVKER